MSEYITFVVIVTQSTLMGTILCQTTVKFTTEMDAFLFQYIICDSVVPHNITIHNGLVWCSWFWDRVRMHNSMDCQLLILFLPQMDCQTKCQNKAITQLLTPCGTSSWTTGLKYYHSWSSYMIALFTTQNIDYSIGQRTNSISQCNSGFYRLPDPDCRCRRTCQ
jgi:hypothetical protein